MVKLPFYSDEQMAAMTEEEQKEIVGVILQSVMAEALASFWSGKMCGDPRVMLAWNRLTLDEQARDDLAEEQLRSWRRWMEIETESANRRAESGEAGTTYVVTAMGYERSRTEAPEPMDSEKK
jgi:hypothetical protein